MPAKLLCAGLFAGTARSYRGYVYRGYVYRGYVYRGYVYPQQPAQT